MQRGSNWQIVDIGKCREAVLMCLLSVHNKIDCICTEQTAICTDTHAICTEQTAVCRCIDSVFMYLQSKHGAIESILACYVAFLSDKMWYQQSDVAV